MAWRLARSLERLRDQVNAVYSGRSKVSDGTIGNAAHAASASDHNPNAAGVVCAMDITADLGGGKSAHSLADTLIQNRHPDLKYIISNRRIAGAWSNWQWQNYSGSNPHTSHIHVSVGVGSDGRSLPPYDDTNDWAVHGGGSAPTPPPPATNPIGVATVVVPKLNVRAQPTSGSPLAGSKTLNQGDTFQYVAVVTGQTVNGISAWLKSTKGNFVWAGGTNKAPNAPSVPAPSPGGTATVTGRCNVRSAPNPNAPLAGSRQLNPGDTFQYSAKVFGAYVGNNNVWYQSTKGNYVWSGNVRG